MPSLGFPSIYNPRTENSFTTGTGTSVARMEGEVETSTEHPPGVNVVHAPCSPDASTRNDYLLRLSEISPQKDHTRASASPGHLSTGRRELSPMRPARKRPATEEQSASQQPSGSKKFKAKLLSQGAEAKSGPKSSTQVLRSSTTHANALLISRNSRCPTSNFPSARTKYKPRQNFQRPTSIASSYLRSQTICKEQDKNVQGQEGVCGMTGSRTSGSFREHFDAVGKKAVAVEQPSRPPHLEKTVRD
jgi:hypothetical protein